MEGRVPPAVQQAESDLVSGPHLINRLDFAAGDCDRAEMEGGCVRGELMEFRGIRKGLEPGLGSDLIRGRNPGGAVGFEDDTTDGCWAWIEKFGKPEGGGATGEDLDFGVSWAGLVRGREPDLELMKLPGVIPDAGGSPFGEDIQPIVPGTLNDGTECGQGIGVETSEGTGLRWKTIEFHRLA